MASLYALCLSLVAFSLCFSLLPTLTISAPILAHSIIPNFTATNIQFIVSSGAFLTSTNGTFKASINNLDSPTYSGFYFSVIHVASNTIIWSANRNVPIFSYSGLLSLTVHGLRISDGSNKVVWSTPRLSSPVAALLLLETGNLILIDAQNISLWESFDYPTDTLVIGHRMYVGTSLVGAVGHSNLSVSDYRLAVTSEDLVLQWKGQTYWKLSMEAEAFKKSDKPVSYMEMNRTGLYLFGADGSEVIYELLSETSDTKIGRLGYEGVFRISSFIGYNSVQDFVKPADICRRPFACGKLGFYSNPDRMCLCPTGFQNDAHNKDGCMPAEDTISLPSSCNESGDLGEFYSSTVYLELQKGMGYFANHFYQPVEHVMNLSVCQDVCSKNCSCLGIFHKPSSGYCYLLQYDLGSLMPITYGEEGLLGYIKAFSTVSVIPEENESHRFPVSSLVMMITFSGLFLLTTIVVVTIIWLRKRRYKRLNFRRVNPSSPADLEMAFIPGLPVRFQYEELVAATENFKYQIGSGGFGTVYKGIAVDKTVVAVKKITSMGNRGKTEFCNETTSVGSIHHVNLVKLRGFCIHERQCFLVYNYMNRGSLEKILFVNEPSDPVLEWQNRYGIALGMARGLAYLHSECQQKIIHCDIKPENILLHDDFQVKISDFGLAKLLSHEHSRLLTALSGTRGYLAPEWLTSHGITDKADVYSYGMVLLELVSGRRNSLFHSSDSGDTRGDDSGESEPSVSLTSWQLGMVYFPLLALEMHKQRKYVELADPRLEGRVRIDEVEKLVKVSLSCLHIVPTLRPTMTNVVAMLEGRLPIGKPRIEALEFLQLGQNHRVTRIADEND